MYVLILAFGVGIVTVNFSISVLPAVPFYCEIDSSPVTIGGVSVIAFVDSVLTCVSRVEVWMELVSQLHWAYSCTP